MAFAGVVIRVPEADRIVAFAHVTLLAPMGHEGHLTDGELAELEEFFAEQVPFEFTLEGESRFPGGVRYLVPEPAQRFSRMTQALHRLFPEYPPYEGQFDLVVPHLTIPDDVVVDGFPIRTRAREATVLRLEGDVFTELASFPLGASAA